jgi:hypothetical protein
MHPPFHDTGKFAWGAPGWRVAQQRARLVRGLANHALRVDRQPGRALRRQPACCPDGDRRATPPARALEAFEFGVQPLRRVRPAPPETVRCRRRRCVAGASNPSPQVGGCREGVLVGRRAPDLLHRLSAAAQDGPIVGLETCATPFRAVRRSIKQCAARFRRRRATGAQHRARRRNASAATSVCQLRVGDADSSESAGSPFVSERRRDVVVRQVGEWRQDGQAPRTAARASRSERQLSASQMSAATRRSVRRSCG